MVLTRIRFLGVGLIVLASSSRAIAQDVPPSVEQSPSDVQPLYEAEQVSPDSQPPPTPDHVPQFSEGALPSNSGAGQEKPQLVRPGYHIHDSFYLRFLFGMGFGGTSMSSPKGSESYKGELAAMGMDLGWSITPRLVVYGEARLSGILEATVKGNPDASKGDINVYEGGPGICYYIKLSDELLVPSWYVSGSMVLQKLTMDLTGAGTTRTLSDLGYGLDVMLGAEWWVWDNWAASAGARFQLGSSKVKDVDARWTTLTGAFILTLTYN